MHILNGKEQMRLAYALSQEPDQPTSAQSDQALYWWLANFY